MHTYMWQWDVLWRLCPIYAIKCRCVLCPRQCSASTVIHLYSRADHPDPPPEPSLFHQQAIGTCISLAKYVITKSLYRDTIPTNQYFAYFIATEFISSRQNSTIPCRIARTTCSQLQSASPRVHMDRYLMHLFDAFKLWVLRIRNINIIF
jgi:hypothetical protein